MKVVATAAANSAMGVILHIKRIDTVTKTLYFDSVGKLGTGDPYSAANIGTVGVDLYNVTITVSPDTAPRGMTRLTAATWAST